MDGPDWCQLLGMQTVSISSQVLSREIWYLACRHSHAKTDAQNVLCRLSEDGYSDDEDTSWKVRRAATKAVSAVVQVPPSLPALCLAA